MTEQEYKDAIAKLMLDISVEVPLEAIRLIDIAVQKHPESASLWQQRAHLILLGPEETPYSLDEALNCYLRALELDPMNVEVVEDIAHFHSAVMDNEIEAQKWFEKSKQMRKNRN
ncbi:MAG TPA: hypothetical protein PK014_09475 [Thermoanaerobaculia bacterium]|nr:hypothetical protein [Thermoanaerobaculia bacterium]HUM30416.1 hypothetical protein [Thermoanaerobaculia bacterium]HXK68573.1 hypothetical protein [Thermoanaerobaculia bacterium]